MTLEVSKLFNLEALSFKLPISVNAMFTPLTMDGAFDQWKELGLICSLNTRHCLLQFNTLHRLHYSKEKPPNIFSEMSPIYEKCNKAEAHLLYSYILCPKLQE